MGVFKGVFLVKENGVRGVLSSDIATWPILVNHYRDEKKVESLLKGTILRLEEDVEKCTFFDNRVYEFSSLEDAMREFHDVVMYVYKGGKWHFFDNPTAWENGSFDEHVKGVVCELED